MAEMTPAAWLEVLEGRLDARWRAIRIYDEYYDGRHRLAFATSKFREAFGSLFAAMADNWCQVVVSAKVDRLKVQGFRFGAQPQADDDAWAIWQWNGLDAESNLAHTEAVKLCESYWLVEPPARGSSDPPRITAEHPSQVIVATAPGDRRQRVAALKKWRDDDGYAYANVYLPQHIAKWRSPTKLRSGSQKIQWSRRQDDPGGANPLGVVPVIPLRNNPSMLGGGQSDLAPVIPLQDLINKFLSDMVVGSEFMAFPQRVAMGIEVPIDPDTGQPTRAAELKATQSRFWAFANENARIGEFSAADLGNYKTALDLVVQHLSAHSRTPPHYLIGQIVNAAGDALKAAETGLVSDVKDKQTDFGEGHEEGMRVSFLALGDTVRASAFDAETIWADPESRSEAEKVDAATKLLAVGVPEEVCWERVGFSPQEIARMKTMQATDSLLAETESVPAAPVAEAA